MKRKNLPIGVQEFSHFKERSYIYVDKTELIHKIISEGQYFFLSRPRRFGKSLLLSTMREIFKGSKDLFEGTWIYNKWDWSQKSPIVHISFASAEIREFGLVVAIEKLLDTSANLNKVKLTQSGVGSRFKELLEKIHKKNGKAVVLIDEYDKAIVDYLDDPNLAIEHRLILRDFFIVLKDYSQYLRFVFITGISKFSKVSIFSAMNQLQDISLNKNYATLTGYTQTELEDYFESYFEEAMIQNNFNREELLQKIKLWYNGYSWDVVTKVYNPFSLLNFFSATTFENYWFSTGTPTFLTILARQQEFYDQDNFEAPKVAFETFDVEDLNAEAIMFQTGYLTLKSYNPEYMTYSLGYPNKEVRQAFLAYMVEAYSFVQFGKIPPTNVKMRNALESKDIETFVELINSMFANIPSHIWDGTSEKYYHSLLHLLLNYLGTQIESEVTTSKGRIDSVVQTKKYIYILEFKFNKSAQFAIDSIKSRRYSEKFLNSDKERVCVGFNFSSETKSINDWLLNGEL